MKKVTEELRQLRRLIPLGFNSNAVNLKERDIDSLSILLFNNATEEFIINNLLSKRKFNILLRYGVFEKIVLVSNRVTYKISSEYQKQVRDIYIKYYGMKFNK